MASAKQVIDMCHYADLEMLSKYQLIGVGTVDDAIQMARVDRSAALEEAMEIFGGLQHKSETAPWSKLLFDQGVKAKLRRIADIYPKHISARVLLMVAGNRLPTKMTRDGSLDALDFLAARLDEISFRRKVDVVGGHSPEKAASKMAFQVQSLRAKIHEDLRPYGDLISEFAVAAREYFKANKGDRNRRELEIQMTAAAKRMRSAALKL